MVLHVYLAFCRDSTDVPHYMLLLCVLFWSFLCLDGCFGHLVWGWGRPPPWAAREDSVAVSHYVRLATCFTPAGLPMCLSTKSDVICHLQQLSAANAARNWSADPQAESKLKPIDSSAHWSRNNSVASVSWRSATYSCQRTGTVYVHTTSDPKGTHMNSL